MLYFPHHIITIITFLFNSQNFAFQFIVLETVTNESWMVKKVAVKANYIFNQRNFIKLVCVTVDFDLMNFFKVELLNGLLDDNLDDDNFEKNHS